MKTSSAATARRFDLWKKLRQLPGLDPRKDRRPGYGPEVLVGPWIYALCSGDGCLSDREALNDDPLPPELFGVGKFADQSQVGEWLREQSDARVAALRQLLHPFVTRVRVPGASLCWGQRWVQRVWPAYGPGRSRLAAASG